jgi:hypothetical protein
MPIDYDSKKKTKMNCQKYLANLSATRCHAYLILL